MLISTSFKLLPICATSHRSGHSAAEHTFLPAGGGDQKSRRRSSWESARGMQREESARYEISTAVSCWDDSSGQAPCKTRAPGSREPVTPV
jgi:hypothetical protein